MKKKIENWKQLEKQDRLKYEIAQEIDLLDKVLSEGWGSLTAKETGKIGGLISKQRKCDEIVKNVQ